MYHWVVLLVPSDDDASTTIDAGSVVAVKRGDRRLIAARYLGFCDTSHGMTSSSAKDATLQHLASATLKHSCPSICIESDFTYLIDERGRNARQLTRGSDSQFPTLLHLNPMHAWSTASILYTPKCKA